MRRPGADDVYVRLYDALLEQRLLPGTRLPEERLAALLGVNRAPVRQALTRLRNEGLVELIPHRGAVVAEPSAAESDDVLEARRVIEPAVVRRLATRADVGDLDALDGHVALERAAHAAGADRDAIRLSGEFHNLLAERAGNRALAHTMRELSARTCLAILVNRAPTATACRPDDHDEIVRAVAAGDGEAAATAVLVHLDRVQESIVFVPAGRATDLDAVFGSQARG